MVLEFRELHDIYRRVYEVLPIALKFDFRNILVLTSTGGVPLGFQDRPSRASVPILKQH